MSCERIDLGDGAVGIVCSRGRRGKTCSACKRNRATLECDWPLTGPKAGKTCDRALCRPCALLVKTAGGDTVDYCPAHAAQHRGEAAPALPPRPPRAQPPKPEQVGLFEPEATRGLFPVPSRKP